MNSNKKPWPLKTIYGIRQRVNTNPDYQRPAVWTIAQKQMLIDSILRDYDVPKLYWRKTGSKPDTYDVVDGQQRLRAVWEYFDGGYKLPKDADLIDGKDVAGCTYEILPDDMRMKLDVYPLDVVVVEDTRNKGNVSSVTKRHHITRSRKAQCISRQDESFRS